MTALKIDNPSYLVLATLRAFCSTIVAFFTPFVKTSGSFCIHKNNFGENIAEYDKL